MPSNFPDQNIFDAYMNPRVDDYKEAFEWGVPDVDNIRRYLQRKLGWSFEKIDQIILPAIRHMASRQNTPIQSTLDSFLKVEPKLHKSKRIRALQKPKKNQ